MIAYELLNYFLSVGPINKSTQDIQLFSSILSEQLSIEQKKGLTQETSSRSGYPQKLTEIDKELMGSRSL